MYLLINLNYVSSLFSTYWIDIPANTTNNAKKICRKLKIESKDAKN